MEAWVARSDRLVREARASDLIRNVAFLSQIDAVALDARLHRLPLHLLLCMRDSDALAVRRFRERARCREREDAAAHDRNDGQRQRDSNEAAGGDPAELGP